MTTPESRAKIAPFVKLHGINMAECKEERVEAYPHFNAFFYRELKPSARPIAAPLDDGVVVSPADCRMVVYPTLSDATKIWVKGHSFTVESLLGPECADVAPLFLGGSLMLARLAPQDYHRWHLPVTGRLGRRHAIDGALFTVNPIAIRRTHPDVYSENKREVLLVHTKPFGLVAMVAVGATVVGSINIVTPNGAFAEKGACHGYFAFGGSTVLVLFQPGTVAFDTDLLRYSMTPLETYVRVGERVARATGAAGGGGEGVAAGARASAGAAPTPRQGIAEDDVDYAAYAARVAAAAASTGAGGGAGEGKEEA
jgi:phosphatidylserine decarboxylase